MGGGMVEQGGTVAREHNRDEPPIPWEKGNDFLLRCGAVHEPYRFCVTVLDGLRDIVAYDEGLFLMLDGNRKISRKYFTGISDHWSSMYLQYYARSSEHGFGLDYDVWETAGAPYVELIDWAEYDWIHDDFMTHYVQAATRSMVKAGRGGKIVQARDDGRVRGLGHSVPGVVPRRLSRYEAGTFGRPPFRVGAMRRAPFSSLASRRSPSQMPVHLHYLDRRGDSGFYLAAIQVTRYISANYKLKSAHIWKEQCMGLMIGRQGELRDLEEWCRSRKAELICVYGRRRVGKTYLVECAFRDRFAFAATGSEDKRMRVQLRVFHEALRGYGDQERAIPADWFEAFERLRCLLEQPDVARTEEGRRVVFLDEFPWFATKRSDFLVAFANFWNAWASKQDDLCVVVCGSATSWIVKNLFENTGSMYDRVTHQMYLPPFTLRETEQMADALGLGWSRDALMRCYMVFGGLPYYLDMLDRRRSLAQNIDSLCLDVRAPLRREVSHLMEATLGDSELHRAILRQLAGVRAGMHRTTLDARLGTSGSGSLKRALDDLEKCGYIRSYHNPYERNHPSIYQLVDPFLLFSFNLLEGKELRSWAEFERTPSYYAWRGIAFETLCLSHIPQIKRAMGIGAVRTEEFPWASGSSSPGAQVDLVVERADGVTDLCEMKYADEEFVVDASYERELRRKREVFAQETGTRNAVHTALVCAIGLKHNTHSWDVTSVVTGDDLFSA